MITASNIVKNFGDTTALSGIDLKINEGEFVTILGPSGSGKTTLLNIIQGFERPTKGNVYVDGQDITQLTPKQREFGMVFQSYALFTNMTVLQNVEYPLRVRGVPKTERRRRALESLEQVELTIQKDRLPRELSGGQQQRVALARALVFNPKVLLMDEPLAALDRRLRQSMQYMIKQLHEKIQATVLYVTHDQEEALVLSDRVCLMNNGAIAQIDTPTEIYHKPANTFVAKFLGETNLLQGRVERRDGQQYAIRVDCETLINLVSNRNMPIDETIIACIRPENIHLSTEDTAVGSNCVRATLKRKTFLGDSWRLEFITQGHTEILVRMSSGGFIPDQGEQAILQIRDVNVTIFND